MHQVIMLTVCGFPETSCNCLIFGKIFQSTEASRPYKRCKFHYFTEKNYGYIMVLPRSVILRMVHDAFNGNFLYVVLIFREAGAA